MRRRLWLTGMIALALLLGGCAPDIEPEPVTVDEDGAVRVGGVLTVQMEDLPLTLLDNKDALAADGLYYATWASGEPEPYENSDGETVDLYDAQLYLLLGVAADEAEAQGMLDNWLAIARENYSVTQEETGSFGGQEYQLLSYDCDSAENPYARGISAFGKAGSLAVCAELTCRENYREDLHTILETFLNNCTYR